jgi:exocyst complex component 6
MIPGSLYFVLIYMCLRGCIVHITATASFQNTLNRALSRLASLIGSKLDNIFEVSEYDWTPKTREDAPSVYLYEPINWLTTVVDGLGIKESYKDEVYRAAAAHIAQCLMV